MDIVTTLVLLAVVVEQVVGIIKSAFPKVRNSYSALAAMLVGITLCISTRVGVLSALNVPIAFPIVDYIISGLLISRGANLIHDLLHGFSNYARNRTVLRK
jgi:fatty acid desaturase